MAALWLTLLHTRNATTLTESTQALPAALACASPSPSIALLVGGRSKTRYLLDTLRGSGGAHIPHSHGQVYLWRDSQPQASTPTVYVDYEMHTYNVSQIQPLSDCSEHRIRSVNWFDSTPSTWTRRFLGNLICSRVLSPIMDVVVYFATDLGGTKSVARILAEQALEEPTCSSPAKLPELLVVMYTTSYRYNERVAHTRLMHDVRAALRERSCNMSELEVQRRIEMHFGNISILGLPKNQLQSHNSRIVRARVTTLAEINKKRRMAEQLLFNKTHIASFATSLLDHFCQTRTVPYSFIRASRPVGFVVTALQSHLDDLLSKVTDNTALWDLAVPLISSSLLLASFPPNSHVFSSIELFEALYEQICENSIRKYTSDESIQQAFIDELKNHFLTLVNYMTDNQIPAASQHSLSLRAIRARITPLRSHHTCLCCMLRTPEKVLTCGHAICNVCISTFGLRLPTKEHTFCMSTCMLCGTAHTEGNLQLVPPTASVRLLTLDGGGLHGIIPLVFLDAISKHFAHLGCSIADYFDIVCGTSAGGLIIIGLFIMDWSSSRCIKRFESLATKTFADNDNGADLFSRVQRFALSYWHDCQQSSVTIEEAFMTDCGHHRIAYFNSLSNNIKVAITSTKTKDSFPCLFCNYNGGIRPKGIGDDIIRSLSAIDDATVSGAAFSTSAAPWSFKRKVMKRLGSFQDGKLHYNSPFDLALWVSKQIWPEKSRPDLVLSIGTGAWDKRCSIDVSGSQSHSKDRSFSRIRNVFVRRLEGDRIWLDLAEPMSSPSRERFHRVNLGMSGKEPPADDVDIMHTLKQETLASLDSQPCLDKIYDTIFASIFYFELEACPNFAKGSYHCRGHIFCRLPLSEQGCRNLYTHLYDSKSYFLVLGHPTRCVETETLRGPSFKRLVRFSVSTLEDTIGISIKGMAEYPRSISGFPVSLAGLINLQGLRSPFGHADHRTSDKPLPSVPHIGRTDKL